jgi:hypothetical protein
MLSTEGPSERARAGERTRLTGFARLSLGCLRASAKRTPDLQVVHGWIISYSSSAGQQTIDLRVVNRAYIGNRTLRFTGILLDGSDGTRTRDLRRDRHVPGMRRLTTIDAQSLY